METATQCWILTPVLPGTHFPLAGSRCVVKDIQVALKRADVCHLPSFWNNKYDLNIITAVLEENKLSWLRVSRPVQRHPRSHQCPWVRDIWSHVFSCLEPGEVSWCILSYGLPGGKADSCWPGPQLPCCVTLFRMSFNKLSFNKSHQAFLGPLGTVPFLLHPHVEGDDKSTDYSTVWRFRC